jgi:hypothetical protein
MNFDNDMIMIRDLRKEDLSELKNLLDALNNALEEKYNINEKNFLSIFMDMEKFPSIYSNYVAVQNEHIVGFVSLIFYKTFLHIEEHA